ADPNSVQASLVGEASIGLRGQPADAECGELILRIVAGDDLEHVGRILNGAAQRSDAGIECRADHSDATDQLLRRRQSHQAVVPCGVMDRSASFFADRAGYQVRADRGSGAAARSAGTALRIVGIAERTAE